MALLLLLCVIITIFIFLVRKPRVRFHNRVPVDLIDYNYYKVPLREEARGVAQERNEKQPA